MITIKIGEQKPFYFSIKEKSSGLGISLVGSIILFQLKEKENQTENYLVEKKITETTEEEEVGRIYNPDAGKFSIFLKSEDTLKLNVDKDYYYTIWKIDGNVKEVISSSGSKVEEFRLCPA